MPLDYMFTVAHNKLEDKKLERKVRPPIFSKYGRKTNPRLCSAVPHGRRTVLAFSRRLDLFNSGGEAKYYQSQVWSSCIQLLIDYANG